MNAEYSLYLKSETWKQKRNQVFQEQGKYCAKCKSKTNLHIHHLTYERIYIEETSDLQVLCKDCHRDVHKIKSKNRSKKKKKKKFDRIGLSYKKPKKW